MTPDPRTLWRETVAPDEDERFDRLGQELVALRRAAATAAGEPQGRTLHTKAHLCAEATFDVLPTAPAELRVSLFATPGPRRAYVRFSNGIGRRQSDRLPDLRGLAIKVLDVPGPKLIPGLEGATTQDFLLITSPVLAFRTVEEFVAFARAEAGGQLLLVPRLIGALGFGRALGLVAALAKLPQPRTLANARFFTAAPTRLGPFAAKFSVTPTGPGGDVRGRGHKLHRDDLAARLREGDLTYTFRAQLYVDDTATPIEDLTVEWSEAKSPWIDLATLTVRRVDVDSPEGRAADERIESHSFDPWHATEELRPLGAVMRARKHAYKHSVIARGAAAEP